MVCDLATPAAAAGPIAFLEHGTRLLLDYSDDKPGNRGLFEWDIASAKVVRSWPRSALRGEYVASPDGRWCLVRPHETRAHFPLEPPQFNPDRGARSLIDLKTGTEQPLDPAVVAGEEIARFSPDGRLFAAPMISTTAVYSVPDFKRVATVSGALSGMHGAAFSPDGRRLVIGATGHEGVRLWDTEGWHQVLTLEADASMFHRIACSPDGNVIGALSFWNTLHLWRAPSWAEIEAAEKMQPRP
jgi:WD40 repeat protein